MYFARLYQVLHTNVTLMCVYRYFSDIWMTVVRMSFRFFIVIAQVHPGGSIATEGSGGGERNHSPPPPDASSLAGSFLQHGFMTKSILEGVQRPKDLVAGSVTIHRPTGCFVTRRLVPPAWIYDQVHPGGSAATEGSGGEVPVTTPRLLRMLRHSQARSSSMDLRSSPSRRERSDRRIWWRGA